MMKNHILAAMREEYNRWEELLAGTREEQIVSPDLPGGWSVKDVIAHLWAWQQRSAARFEAALLDREPVFPDWPPDFDPEAEVTTDGLNAWIYSSNRQKPWSEVYQDWRAGFRRLLELAEQVSEKDLLDGSRYAWMEGRPLALVMLASYDHHHEHLEEVQTWLQEHGETGTIG